MRAEDVEVIFRSYKSTGSDVDGVRFHSVHFSLFQDVQGEALMLVICSGSTKVGWNEKESNLSWLAVSWLALVLGQIYSGKQQA